jgi:hypothetical protein
MKSIAAIVATLSLAASAFAGQFVNSGPRVPCDYSSGVQPIPPCPTTGVIPEPERLLPLDFGTVPIPPAVSESLIIRILLPGLFPLDFGIQPIPPDCSL